jgi:hypothetical protein
MRRSGKAQERDRTADLVLTKDVLYQLSYLGVRTIEPPLAAFAGGTAPGIQSRALSKRETGFEPATLSLEG